MTDEEEIDDLMRRLSLLERHLARVDQRIKTLKQAQQFLESLNGSCTEQRDRGASIGTGRHSSNVLTVNEDPGDYGGVQKMPTGSVKIKQFRYYRKPFAHE